MILDLPCDHEHFEQPSKPVGNKLLCNSDFLSASQIWFIFANTRDTSAEAAVIEAQVATKGQSPCFLLHPPHQSIAVSHIADMWELTPWKWKPEEKEDRDLLPLHWPWQVIAVLSLPGSDSSVSCVIFELIEVVFEMSRLWNCYCCWSWGWARR